MRIPNIYQCRPSGYIRHHEFFYTSEGRYIMHDGFEMLILQRMQAQNVSCFRLNYDTIYHQQDYYVVNKIC